MQQGRRLRAAVPALPGGHAHRAACPPRRAAPRSKENTSPVSRHAYTVHLVEGAPDHTWQPQNWWAPGPLGPSRMRRPASWMLPCCRRAGVWGPAICAFQHFGQCSCALSICAGYGGRPNSRPSRCSIRRRRRPTREAWRREAWRRMLQADDVPGTCWPCTLLCTCSRTGRHTVLHLNAQSVAERWAAVTLLHSKCQLSSYHFCRFSSVLPGASVNFTLLL